MKIVRITVHGIALLFTLLIIVLRFLWDSLITLAGLVDYDDSDEDYKAPDTRHFNHHSGVSDPIERHDGHYK